MQQVSVSYLGPSRELRKLRWSWGLWNLQLVSESRVFWDTLGFFRV